MIVLRLLIALRKLEIITSFSGVCEYLSRIGE